MPSPGSKETCPRNAPDVANQRPDADGIVVVLVRLWIELIDGSLFGFGGNVLVPFEAGFAAQAGIGRIVLRVAIRAGDVGRRILISEAGIRHGR